MKIIKTKKNELQTNYYGNTLDVIDEKFTAISGILHHDVEMQDVVTSRIAGKMIMDNVEKDYKFSKIDIEKDVEEFLKMQNSISTRKSYLKSIFDFRSFCLRQNYDFVKTDIHIAREYLEELNSEFSSRTVRTKIAGVKSFFNCLLHKHYGVINVNPFSTLKLPPIVDKFELDYPKLKDVEVLKKDLQRIGRKDVCCLVELLYKYGWRVGILNNFQLGQDGRFVGISKGKVVKGKLTKNETKQIFDNDVLKLKSGTISSMIFRITKRLFKSGKVSCEFSCHDLRRARITVDVNSCNNISELMKVSKKYHKELTTTMLYVRDFSLLKQ